jgi:hypothetical protein
VSARDDRARDVARWRKLTMTDAELAEIGRAADRKLADEDASSAELELRTCRDCADPIPNQMLGGLCADCFDKEWGEQVGTTTT